MLKYGPSSLSPETTDGPQRVAGRCRGHGWGMVVPIPAPRQAGTTTGSIVNFRRFSTFFRRGLFYARATR
jgi:hypothetical protein